MKYSYRVTINQDAEGDEYSFRYGSTHNIRLRVCEQGATLTAEMGKNYAETISGSYALQLIREGVKRAALVHLLKFHDVKPLRVETVTLRISEPSRDKETELCSLDISPQMELFQLIKPEQSLRLPTEWSGPQVIQTVVGGLKSDTKEENRKAALYAYLCAKSGYYEMERFSYLWMAMNGLYSHVYALLPDGNEKAGEMAKMLALLQKFDRGNKIPPRKINNIIGGSTRWALNQYIKSGNPGNVIRVTKASLRGSEHQALADKVWDIVKKHWPDDYAASGLDAYSYLISGFAYYLRCRLLHAGEPLPLFSFAADWEILTLQVVNGLLEEFLDDYLWETFR